MPTSTDKVPNTSATAASSGTDLNGAAVKNACEMLRARLARVAAGILPAVEPGFQPGGSGVESLKAMEESAINSGGKMPPSTAGRMPAATAKDMVFADGFVFHREFPNEKISFAESSRTPGCSASVCPPPVTYATPENSLGSRGWTRQAVSLFRERRGVTEVEVDGFHGNAPRVCVWTSCTTWAIR